MNKIDKMEKNLGIKNLKFFDSKLWKSLRIVLPGIAMAAALTACDPKVDTVDATTNVPSQTVETTVPTSSEVEPTTEVTPSTTEVVEPTDVVDPTEVIEDNKYVEVNEVISLIENLAAKYPEIDKNQLVAAVVTTGLDHIDAETYDKIVDTYALSDEDLYNQFVEFACTYRHGVLETSRYTRDIADADGQAYAKLPKMAEFAMTDADREIAMNYDENCFAANASPQYGSIAVGEDADFDQFDGVSSMEAACRSVQYLICDGLFPELFQPFANQITK